MEALHFVNMGIVAVSNASLPISVSKGNDIFKKMLSDNQHLFLKAYLPHLLLFISLCLVRAYNILLQPSSFQK